MEYRNISKWVKVTPVHLQKSCANGGEKGYIRGKTVKRGKMPEKTVYQITETGEEFFLKLMEETARQPIRLFLDFNAVIMSLNLVSEQERRELTGRMEQEIEVMQKPLRTSRRRERMPLTGRSILEQQYRCSMHLPNG